MTAPQDSLKPHHECTALFDNQRTEGNVQMADMSHISVKSYLYTQSSNRLGQDRNPVVVNLFRIVIEHSIIYPKDGVNSNNLLTNTSVPLVIKRFPKTLP